MGNRPQHCRNTEHLTFQFQDQDSSSTQSTGQSYPEVVSMRESNPCGQGMVSPKSGLVLILILILIIILISLCLASA